MHQRSLPERLAPLLLPAALSLAFFACGGATDGEGGDGDGEGTVNPDGNNVDGYGDGTEKYENGSFAGCTNPAPLLPTTDSGYYRCQEAMLWRKEKVTCQNNLDLNNVVEFPDIVLDSVGGASGSSDYSIVADECASNADCPEKSRCWVGQVNASGECIDPSDYFQQWARTCQPGCTEDADCGADQVCVCGPEIGYCTAASGEHGCSSDADCGDGYHCLQNYNGGFGCQLPGDACHSGKECDAFEECQFSFELDARECSPSYEGC